MPMLFINYLMGHVAFFTEYYVLTCCRLGLISAFYDVCSLLLPYCFVDVALREGIMCKVRRSCLVR